MSPLMIMGGAAAGMALIAGLQTWRLAGAQEEIGTLKASVVFQVQQTEEAVGVNERLNGSVDELAGKIAGMIEARRIEREERDELLAARDVDIAAARDAARRLQGEVNDIFRNDLQCADLGSLRVDVICPAIAARLRERTTRHSSSNGGADGGDSGGSDDFGSGSTDAPHLLSAHAGH